MRGAVGRSAPRAGCAPGAGAGPSGRSRPGMVRGRGARGWRRGVALVRGRALDGAALGAPSASGGWLVGDAAGGGGGTTLERLAAEALAEKMQRMPPQELAEVLEQVLVASQRTAPALRDPPWGAAEEARESLRRGSGAEGGARGARGDGDGGRELQGAGGGAEAGGVYGLGSVAAAEGGVPEFDVVSRKTFRPGPLALGLFATSGALFAVGITPLLRESERLRKALGIVAQGGGRRKGSEGGGGEEGGEAERGQGGGGGGVRQGLLGGGGGGFVGGGAPGRARPEMGGGRAGDGEVGEAMLWGYDEGTDLDGDYDYGVEDEDAADEIVEEEGGVGVGPERMRPIRGLSEERLTAAARRRGYRGIPTPTGEDEEAAAEWYSVDGAYDEGLEEGPELAAAVSGWNDDGDDDDDDEGQRWWPEEDDGRFALDRLDFVPTRNPDDEKGRGMARRMVWMADEPWPRELGVWHEIPEGRAVDYDPMLKFEYRMDMDGSGRSFVKVSRAVGTGKPPGR